jgi:hypothetical protein
MSEKPADYGREVRDTIVKSSLTGVAATVLAVTIFSPAGFGGMIGTSLASGFGIDPTTSSADNPYAVLPAYPAPLSAEELDTIRSQLARTTASLELTRAATEAKIEHIRAIALSNGATFAPMPRSVQVASDLRLTTSEEVAFAAPPVAVAAPVEAAPVSYTFGAPPQAAEFRDPNLELADLLLAHETF